MTSKGNESLSTTVMSLHLPRLAKSRPSSCRTSVLFPKRARVIRPSSSLEPGSHTSEPVRMSMASVNGSESSGGTCSSDGSTTKPSVESRRVTDSKPTIVTFEIPPLINDWVSAPSHWQRFPTNLPPLKQPKKSFQQTVPPKKPAPSSEGLFRGIGLRPRFVPKKAPRQSMSVRNAKWKKEQNEASRFEKAFEVLPAHV